MSNVSSTYVHCKGNEHVKIFIVKSFQRYEEKYLINARIQSHGDMKHYLTFECSFLYQLRKDLTILISTGHAVLNLHGHITILIKATILKHLR